MKGLSEQFKRVAEKHGVQIKDCCDGYRQRKAREEIESLRELHGGKEILNNYEQLTMWQTVLNSYFKPEATEKRGTLCAHGNNA